MISTISEMLVRFAKRSRLPAVVLAIIMAGLIARMRRDFVRHDRELKLLL
jgi:hypothetical protein